MLENAVKSVIKIAIRPAPVCVKYLIFFSHRSKMKYWCAELKKKIILNISLKKKYNCHNENMVKFFNCKCWINNDSWKKKCLSHPFFNRDLQGVSDFHVRLLITGVFFCTNSIELKLKMIFS